MFEKPVFVSPKIKPFMLNALWHTVKDVSIQSFVDIMFFGMNSWNDLFMKYCCSSCLWVHPPVIVSSPWNAWTICMLHPDHWTYSYRLPWSCCKFLRISCPVLHIYSLFILSHLCMASSKNDRIHKTEQTAAIHASCTQTEYISKNTFTSTPSLHIYTYTDIKMLFCIIQQLLEVFMNLFTVPHIWIYCHDFSMPIDGVWIGNWIYWTLWYAWLHFTVRCYTRTSVQSHVSTTIAW
jgi:hypothetical protein